MLLGLSLLSVAGCDSPLHEVKAGPLPQPPDTVSPPAWAEGTGTGALLATRFNSLGELRSVVRITYLADGDGQDSAHEGHACVRLTHRCHDREVVGELASGLSQGDIMKVQTAGVVDQLGLMLASPYAVANRVDLQRAYALARRRDGWYGEGDPAFLDIAQRIVEHIRFPEWAPPSQSDTSEKGYLNSFNHLTAQALITSIFSEEMADFIADLHERHNMPELITGQFTDRQLTDPKNNPTDNYVDIINNEWGQELGLQLRKKYRLTRDTWWTPRLMTDYLNDMQSYYSWAFKISFKPFRPDEELVMRFAGKINTVMRRSKFG